MWGQIGAVLGWFGRSWGEMGQLEGQFLGGWGGRGGWGHTCRVVTSSPTPSPDCCPLPVQSWGGKENGFGLAECCRDLHMMVSPGWQTGGP